MTDEFLVAPDVAGASITAGTLDLSNAGGTLLQTLAVSGSLAGNSFVLLPQPFFSVNVGAPAPTGATAVVLVAGTLQTGPPPTAPAGSGSGQFHLERGPAAATGTPRPTGAPPWLPAVSTAST